MGFDDDDKWQKEQRDRFLVPYYAAHSQTFVMLDGAGCARETQKRIAVDTFMQMKNGSALGIEEKIVRNKHDKFFLEIESCTIPGREAQGWMRYGMSDRLLYCFFRTMGDGLFEYLECYMIDFPALLRWFWLGDHRLGFDPSYRVHTLDTGLCSRGVLVPIGDVRHAVETQRFRMCDDGEF